MLVIYSLIVFNYSLLRGAKDALLITAPQSGAIAIPFIKVWVILPMAFLSTLIFTRLSNRFNREKVFYIIISAFLTFFALFGFVLYPLHEHLHPHVLADQLQAWLPTGLQGAVALFRNWTFALFYVMSELWGTMIMTVLFWGFANEVTSVNEAKRFYAILGVGANMATVCAGFVGIFLSSHFLHTTLMAGGDRWGQSIFLITSLIVVTGLLAMLLYRKLTHASFQKEIVESRPLREGSALRMGIRKNFSYLAKSKYLICIAIIVLTYNLSLNLVEVVWKDQVLQLFPYAADYNVFMDKSLIYIGIVSTLFSFFICGQVLRRFGWTVGAYLTPIILFFSGLFFFITVLWRDAPFTQNFAHLAGTTPLVLCAYLGMIQNVLSRASKFTFFDVTKEMAFIPLNAESKLKGKAAIDGVGSRFGKSGGSVFHQFLLASGSKVMWQVVG